MCLSREKGGGGGEEWGSYGGIMGEFLSKKLCACIHLVGLGSQVCDQHN